MFVAWVAAVGWFAVVVVVVVRSVVYHVWLIVVLEGVLGQVGRSYSVFFRCCSCCSVVVWFVGYYASLCVCSRLGVVV